jgi:uncharacterized membrane protein
MHLLNPFQMNDWDNKTFFWAFQAFQLAFVAVVCLGLAGYQIPIAREALAFLYLTFLPGVLVLKALRLHDRGTIETVLYSVGLSLAFLMLTGLAANTVYPLLGYARPFSFEMLFLTIVAVMQVLLYLALIRDRGHAASSPELAIPSSPAAPFLMLLPFFAIIGTYVRNEYHMVTFLFLLLVLIAIIVLAVGFDRLIPASCYGLAIYTIALSLLYHTSLISEYIWGYDIHHELHLVNSVLIPGLWDMSMPYNTNGMLSVVALVPIYSLICNLDPVWVFKILYPLLFALVPLGLYRAVEKQTDARIGFLSIFFFFAFFTFYTEMISLARQQIAELFLTLTILAMIDKSMARGRQAFLMVTFGFAMIVSHYGLSYIYFFSLVPAWLLLVVPERLGPWLPERLTGISGFLKSDPLAPSGTGGGGVPVRTLVLPYILVFAALAYLWYSMVAEGTALATVTGIGDRIWSTLFADSFSPTAAQGMHILTSQSVTPLHGLAKLVHIATQGLIAVGLLATLARRERWRIEPEYLAISLVFLLINVAGIVVPFFASSLNTSRLYHITLIFLAPFAIIGGIALYEALAERVRAIAAAPLMGTAYKSLSAFLVVFFLFNSGLIYQVVDDSPTSMALETTGDKPVFNGKEVQGARWLFSEGNERPIYVDGTRWWLLQGFDPRRQRYIPANASLLEPNTYLYFGAYNLAQDSVRIEAREHAVTTADYVDAGRFIQNQHKVYDNAGSTIYYR